MPVIMTLEGLRPSLLGRVSAGADLLGLPVPTVKSTTLAGLRGVADTLIDHWFIALVGLAVGGWWADKHLSPAGASWGHDHANHARERALHGRRRRR